MRRALVLCLLAALHRGPSAFGADLESALVADINDVPVARGSSPDGFVTVGNLVLFTADDLLTGRELWRTDGTPSGTYPLLDACPGECSGGARTIGVSPGGYFFQTVDATDATGRCPFEIARLRWLYTAAEGRLLTGARLMHATDRFSLRALPERHAARDFRRQLLLDGQSTDTVVEGDEIVRQYACGDLFLLITSYDYYDGVSQWFYVVDGCGRVKDEVSTPDRLGFLEGITVEGESQLSFGFFATNDRWTLTLRESGVWSFTAADLARRAGRFLLRRRYLSLSSKASEPVVAA